LKPLSIKILRSRLDKPSVWAGALFALIILFFWLDVSASAATAIDTAANKAANNKIRITSDKMIAAMDAGQIEFIGNVKATQTNTVIHADRLKIIYSPNTDKNQAPMPQPTSIEKITARGRVKIFYENIIAETDTAEYTTKSAVLVLIGEGSKVSKGGNSISGTKFILQRSSGNMTVEGNGDNRVKALLGSAERNK
jgi:lipopolysaccharide transport protein LptA